MNKSFSGSGFHGFIGSALHKRLLNIGMTETDPEEADFYFFFGSPSSQILFRRDRNSCIQETVGRFLDVCNMCRKNRTKLIYPSSSTVYNAENAYAHTKRALEAIQNAYDFPILGLRIFAGYGIGEDHKRDYGSVVNQWIDCMMNNERPVIYGDGTQTRDFVYIDDIVESILSNLYTVGQIDVGTGVSTSFNRIVEIINYSFGYNLNPIYIGKPSNYLQDTTCKNPLNKFVSIEDGISKMIGAKC